MVGIKDTDPGPRFFKDFNKAFYVFLYRLVLLKLFNNGTRIDHVVKFEIY